ncbi:hypothetical protein GBA65_21900 (plasmid) [Rubrobacter marinus]|uniref:Uncharacterized protein n=1 Tax=Rubrobacter marinus TaxID=2653852 RepID=A0A6G8Q3N3_9ACTN|nr:hypothetical protein [Rubrobacter marinus]QIN81091.1 hypothetical protein GBA65_21900 [Rubrobacter marinus]
MTDKPPFRTLARYDPPISRTILLDSAGGIVLTSEEIIVRGERLPLASSEPPYTYATAPRRLAALECAALAATLVAYRPEAPWHLLLAGLAAVAAWVNLLTRTTLVLRGDYGEHLYEVWGRVGALDDFAGSAFDALMRRKTEEARLRMGSAERSGEGAAGAAADERLVLFVPVAGVLADGTIPPLVPGSAIVGEEPGSIGDRLLVYYVAGEARNDKDLPKPYAARAALAAARLRNRIPTAERAILPAIMLEPVARLRLEATGPTTVIEPIEDEYGAVERARASLSRWLGVPEEDLDGQLARRSPDEG